SPRPLSLHDALPISTAVNSPARLTASAPAFAKSSSFPDTRTFMSSSRPFLRPLVPRMEKTDLSPIIGSEFAIQLPGNFGGVEHLDRKLSDLNDRSGPTMDGIGYHLGRRPNSDGRHSGVTGWLRLRINRPVDPGVDLGGDIRQPSGNKIV